jgi:uncharacterized protein VirK/YbjX
MATIGKIPNLSLEGIPLRWESLNRLKHDFLQTYTYFVLNSPTGEIQDYLKPFLDNFNASEFVVNLLREFVLAKEGQWPILFDSSTKNLLLLSFNKCHSVADFFPGTVAKR